MRGFRGTLAQHPLVLYLTHHALSRAVDISLAIVDRASTSAGCCPVKFEAVRTGLKDKIYF